MAKVKFTAKTKDAEIEHSEGQIIFDVREGEESISVDMDNKRITVARPGSGFSNVTQNDLDSSITEHAEDTTAHQDIRQNIAEKIIEIREDVENLGNEMETADSLLKTRINNIEEKIPNQASSTNQLADKEFTNSTMTSMVARYVTSNSAGDQQFASLNALRAGPWYRGGAPYTPTENDYAIYIEADKSVWRAIYEADLWSPAFKINDTPFTAVQSAAINSNITSELVQKILTGEVNINALQTAITNLENNKLNKSHNADPNAHADIRAALNAGGLPSITGIEICRPLNVTNTNLAWNTEIHLRFSSPVPAGCYLQLYRYSKRTGSKGNGRGKRHVRAAFRRVDNDADFSGYLVDIPANVTSLIYKSPAQLYKPGPTLRSSRRRFWMEQNIFISQVPWFNRQNRVRYKFSICSDTHEGPISALTLELMRYIHFHGSHRERETASGRLFDFDYTAKVY